MSDERDTNTESPEQSFVTPGEPVIEPEIDLEPPTRGLMPYAIVVGAVIAIVVLATTMIVSDRTGLVDDGDVVVAKKLIDETMSAPTVVDGADTEEEPAVIRLAGIDASECDLSQIEVKAGALVIERACLKLVFEDVPTLPAP